MPNRLLEDVTAYTMVDGRFLSGPHYFREGQPICGEAMPDNATMNVIALTWGPVIDCEGCRKLAYPKGDGDAPNPNNPR